MIAKLRQIFSNKVMVAVNHENGTWLVFNPYSKAYKKFLKEQWLNNNWELAMRRIK